MANVKCRQCGKEIDKSKSIKVSERGYCCCRECAELYNNKDNDKKSKEVNSYRTLTNFIQEIYEKNSFDKKEINWSLETARIQQIKERNKDLQIDDLGIIECLKYLVNVKKYNLFDDNGGSILNLVPYYYIESKLYLKQKEFIDDLIKECKEYGYSTKPNEKKQLLNYLQRLMRKNENFKISGLKLTIKYLQEIRGFSLFNENEITILKGLEYYYEEAKQNYIQTKKIEKELEDFNFDNEKSIIIHKHYENKPNIPNWIKPIDMNEII